MRDQKKQDNRRSRNRAVVDDNVVDCALLSRPNDRTVANPQSAPDGIDYMLASNPDQSERTSSGERPLDQSNIQRGLLQNRNGGDSEIRDGFPHDSNGIHESDPLESHHIQPGQIQQLRTPDNTSFDDDHSFSREKKHINQQNHGDSWPISPWNSELDLEGVGYEDIIEPTLECYFATPSTEERGNCSLTWPDDTFRNLSSIFSDIWTLDYPMSDSMLLPGGTDGLYSMGTLNEIPLLSRETPDPEQHDQHNAKQLLKQDPPRKQHGQVAPSTHYPRDCLSGDYSDRDDHRLAVDIQPSSDEGSAVKKLLACPWYKKNPWKYQDCSKFKLLRFKDVKQHAYRKHMQPESYCPVCFKTFSNASVRDRHIQKQNCTARPARIFDGITEQQKKTLNRKANRGRDDGERWYNMWDTIFPRECRPRSPYLGSGGEEFMSLLRNHWNKKWREIIAAVSQEPHDKFEPEIIQRIVNSIFDRLEVESSNLGSTPDEYSNSMLEETPAIPDLSFETLGSTVREDLTPPQCKSALGTWESSGQDPTLEPDFPLVRLAGHGDVNFNL